MGVAERRVCGGRAVHVDNAARLGSEWVRFHNCDIFERARLAFANEAVGIESAGKIESVQPVSRLDDIEHAQNSARLSGMREFDLYMIEQRLFFELRDQLSSIDGQLVTDDFCTRSETHSFNMDQPEF